MKNNEANEKKYEGSMKEYVKNMKKYQESLESTHAILLSHISSIFSTYFFIINFFGKISVLMFAVFLGGGENFRGSP